jgi:cytoskeleton protein RodZ
VEPQPADSVEPIRVGVVRMIFEQESWVEIKDRSGNTIFGQLNPAGSRRRASGEPPLSIVIGNAAGVRLNYNDEDVDLAPHTRVDVARLTLD